MKKFPIAALFALATLAFGQDKCIDLCSSCMNNDRQDVCAKVESLCKCTEILDNLQQELANPNPVTAVDSTSADTLQNDSLAKADSTVQKDSVITVVTSQDTQVVEKRSVSSEDGKNINVNVTVVTGDAPKDTEQQKKERIFYLGLSLGFEQFQEKTVANYKVEAADEIYDHIGANLGFFLRWYFYSAGSFQFGINAIYHHGYYDIEESDYRVGGDRYYYNHDVSINYHNIMAEIPLTFRFGIPFVISPYLSLGIHVRKPIYAWVDYDVDVSVGLGDYYSYSNRNYDYDDKGSYDGDYADTDWEFLGYLGFGIEFTRHVSIQWQMLLINAVTNIEENINYKLLVDTWRLSLDIAF